MADLLILGVDTDAGKTTFALLWLARFAERCEYWKPVETGPSDSDRVDSLVPAARIHPPIARFSAAVAPSLAAQREGRAIPSADAIVRGRPTGTSLVIETFGGPFSPLNDRELQIELIRMLAGDAILTTSSRVGAVGRVLAMREALAAAGVVPRAVVLLGPRDEWAEREIAGRSGLFVVGLNVPDESWTVDLIAHAADEQAEPLDRLREHLETPQAAVAPDADWREADRRFVWHPYTPLQPSEDPVPIVGADAEFLHLADGRRLIDGISSWWTIQHGHRHPPLMTALTRAAAKIDHVLFAGATHPWGARLAEALIATTPWSGGRVFYSDNGSTAVEVALKLAVQYWQLVGQPRRTTFVGFEHSYHGDTFGAMALSRDPIFFGRFESLLCRAEILPLDPDRLDIYLRTHAGEVAAVLVEPILQAAGGMRLHSDDTLRRLFETARRHDVLFLCDEVLTGLGRLGTFWAHQSAGIEPDAIVSAKTLAGGMLPLAATLVSPRLVGAFDSADRARTFFHGHSFTGHPLACAVALENIPLTKACLPDVPRAVESIWKAAFADARDWPGVRDVRIRGIVAAIELDVPGGYLADVGRVMRQTALERGVLLRPLGNVLYTLPPWRASRSSLARIADAMKTAVLSTRDAVRG